MGPLHVTLLSDGECPHPEPMDAARNLLRARRAKEVCEIKNWALKWSPGKVNDPKATAVLELFGQRKEGRVFHVTLIQPVMRRLEECGVTTNHLLEWFDRAVEIISCGTRDSVSVGEVREDVSAGKPGSVAAVLPSQTTERNGVVSADPREGVGVDDYLRPVFGLLSTFFLYLNTYAVITPKNAGRLPTV